MKEQFPQKNKPTQESMGSLSQEQQELFESEIAVNIKVVNLLKTYFEASFFHAHKESGTRRLYLQFGIGQEGEREKVSMLLDLIGIIPYESKDLNEIMIDSRFDVEKLTLLGVIPADASDDEESLENNTLTAEPYVFGAFPTPAAQKIQLPKKGTRTSSGLDKVDDETLSVSEYIDSNEFYNERLVEELVKERGLYTNIDSSSGFNFLRNKSKYEWRRKENGKMGLFSKKNSQEINKAQQLKYIKDAQEEIKSGAVNKEKLNEVVQMHIPLVYFVLNNLLSAGFRIRSLEDSLQEGVIALQKAIERYDASLGAISSYAVQYIEGCIRNYNAGDDLVRIPPYIQDLRAQVRRVGQHMEQVDAKTPTIKNVARLLDVEPEKLEEKLNGTMWHQILDPIEDYVNSVVDEINTSPDESVLVDQLKKQIVEVLDSMTSRQRKVLMFRFGLMGEEEKTQEEIGRMFGVTGGRIGQIEAKALRGLRHPSRSDVLKEIFDYTDNSYQSAHNNTLENPSLPIHPNNRGNTTSGLHDENAIERNS